MAGLGRKIFTSGEILTAADLQGYAVDQSVMVFDDDTARGSAIPSPSEGMVTYLKDTDILEKYDGAAFVPVGGLVATKTALKTDTFSASVTAGNNVAVTGLSITHTMQNANNKIFLSGNFGVAGSSSGLAEVGLVFRVDSTLIGLGDTDGSRTRVTTGGRMEATSTSTRATSLPSGHILYSPGDTSSHTYYLDAVNINTSTRTLYVNRNELDSNTAIDPRGASMLTLMEVAV